MLKKKPLFFLFLFIFTLISFTSYFLIFKKTSKIDLKEIKDNGDWVLIINDEMITKESFELYYQFFIKLFSLESGISEKQFYLKDQNKMKMLALEKFIENETIFLKAIDEPFFKGDEGKSILENIYKEALSQFLLYKNVFSSLDLDSVTPDILEDFYNELKSQYPPEEINNLKKRGIFYSKEGENIELKNFYKKTTLSTKIKKVQDQMVLESSISKNSAIFFDYFDGKLTKEEIKKDPEKYWLFNINGNKIFLLEYIHVIDYHLDSNKKSKMLDGNKQWMENFKNTLLEKFKFLELSYRKALMLGYQDLEEGKIFVRFLKKKEITSIYLIKNIFSDFRIEKKEINDFLKSSENKDKISQYLKKIGYGNLSKKDYQNGAESYLKQYQMEKKKADFVNQLKEEYFIRISEKYFEQKSLKIQEKILNNNS